MQNVVNVQYVHFTPMKISGPKQSSYACTVVNVVEELDSVTCGCVKET